MYLEYINTVTTFPEYNYIGCDHQFNRNIARLVFSACRSSLCPTEQPKLWPPSLSDSEAWHTVGTVISLLGKKRLQHCRKILIIASVPPAVPAVES